MAWRKTGSWTDHNGHYNESWTDEEGNVQVWELIDKNEWVIIDIGVDEDNPNPDDGGGARGDFESAIALAKQKGHGMITINPQKFPHWKGQTSRGKGLDPVHNPDPSSLYQEYEQGGGGGGPGGGFGGDGESFSQWLRNRIKHGGSGGNGDGDDDKDPPPGRVSHGEELPGPPELVNPPTGGKR
jgi:hypothetical protein